MRIRKYINRKKEIIFLACAVFLTLLIISYLFSLVRHLSKKATTVFGPPITIDIPNADFDFAKYNEIVKKFTKTTTSSQP